MQTFVNSMRSESTVKNVSADCSSMALAFYFLDFAKNAL